MSRLLAVTLFSASMLLLRDCCANWSYPALFAAMAGALAGMALAIAALDRALHGWCSALKNDKGPAEPGL
ncbi:hypothetical protein [Mitsuaria sp. PDC51]|uniref:hypothetical protein n=1 Tax=Mitsuaria sp. PDC51 TaxID=1881035 RepID=UPI001C31D412|nr:hypothetical protein [Mitsuaria sp. PDC51]